MNSPVGQSDDAPTIADALTYLATFTDYEQKAAHKLRAAGLDLGRMHRFAAAVGHPERAFRSVHITGSKGKGSTTFMIDAILRAAGIRTGRFISPHLSRLNERIAIDGRDISDARFAERIRTMRPYIERTRRENPADLPTFFECMTTAAFAEFADRGVSVGVVEVGLGGRLDATNIIESECSVITMLDLEHTRVLGKTLEKIAFEKAGIVKHGRPLVSGVPFDTPEGRVIERIARERESAVHRLGEEILVRNVECVRGEIRFDVHLPDALFSGLRLRAFGAHQAANAGLAVAAARIVAERAGVTLDVHAVREGLLATTLPARLEVFPPHSTDIALPYPLLLDSAHTPKSMQALARAIPDVFGAVRPTLVFGILRDKNLFGCIEPLLSVTADILVTDVRSPRAIPAYELMKLLRAHLPEKRVAILPHLGRAPDQLGGLAVEALVITGSAYLAGEVRGALRASPRG